MEVLDDCPCPKIDNEVEVSTTWGFPESIDPETVIFFDENDFALTLESDAKTKKAVLCKSMQQKTLLYNNLGTVLDADCLAKIERFYPKPDYREILVHERGNSKRSNQKNSCHSKQGVQRYSRDNMPVPCHSTKKNEKMNQGGGAGSYQNRKSDSLSISGESKQSNLSPRSDSSSTLPKPVLKPGNVPSSPVGLKRAPSSSPISSKLPKQEPLDFPATTTYQDLGLTDHTGAYPCIYCTQTPQTFMTMNELRAHCIEQHKTDKPFKCKFCVKCFRNSRQLLLHTFTHTGEKHYTCLYCPQKFRQPGHRNNHMRINHGDALPYKCNQDNCTAVFASSIELARHNKHNHVVRTTKCRACQVSFSNHNLYKQHVCPKKDRKMNCGACGEKFYRMADVLHHAKFCKYIDPDDVTCEKCGTKFVNAAKCSVHKTYLCTGEPVSVKEEKTNDLSVNIKEEIVDFDEVCNDKDISGQSEELSEPQVITVDDQS